MKNVFEKFENKHLFLDPFPHIVINNALPIKENSEIIQELSYAKSIALSEIDKKNIQGRYTIPNKLINSEKNFLKFNAFNEAHSDKEFGSKVIEIFKPYIHEHLPELPMNEIEDYSKPEASFMVNNPPIASSYSPRGPHLDNRKDIFAFLYYVCQDDKKVKGGNLQLFKYKDYFRGFDRGSRIDQGYLKPESIELVKEIEYKNNTLVILLNGINSVHGVEPLGLESSPRTYFTGGCQYKKDCYFPESYLNTSDLIKDKTGELWQKAIIKLFGHRSYGN